MSLRSIPFSFKDVSLQSSSLHPCVSRRISGCRRLFIPPISISVCVLELPQNDELKAIRRLASPPFPLRPFLFPKIQPPRSIVDPADPLSAARDPPVGHPLSFSPPFPFFTRLSAFSLPPAMTCHCEFRSFGFHVRAG